VCAFPIIGRLFTVRVLQSKHCGLKSCTSLGHREAETSNCIISRVREPNMCFSAVRPCAWKRTRLITTRFFITRIDGLIDPAARQLRTPSFATMILPLLCLFASFTSVNAAASLSPIVECSSIKVPPNTTFQACATTYLETPSPASIGGETTLVGGYLYQYTIVTGLKKGTDTSTLWKIDLDKAKANGIVVEVKLDDDNKCKVSIDVKDKSTACKSCKPCGNEKFTADCTNVPNGRVATCESTATGRVYFPLVRAALRATVSAPFRFVPKPPKAAPVKAATPKAPVRQPPKVPTRPVSPPRRRRRQLGMEGER
jgi:hypothetical protein